MHSQQLKNFISQLNIENQSVSKKRLISIVKHAKQNSKNGSNDPNSLGELAKSNFELRIELSKLVNELEQIRPSIKSTEESARTFIQQLLETGNLYVSDMEGNTLLHLAITIENIPYNSYHCYKSSLMDYFNDEEMLYPLSEALIRAGLSMDQANNADITPRQLLADIGYSDKLDSTIADYRHNTSLARQAVHSASRYRFFGKYEVGEGTRDQLKTLAFPEPLASEVKIFTR